MSDLIYEIQPEKRYWVVKTDHGKFFEHFKQNSLIAIGHLDDLSLAECKKRPYEPDFTNLKKELEKSHLETKKRPGYTTNHFKQVRSFISDLKIGDWVIIKNEEIILIGRVTGFPRISKEPLYKKPVNIEQKLTFQLRRKVHWGPYLPIRNVPLALKNSLSAQQSFYNIDRHKIAIHHLIFPWFKCSDNLYLSARINTEKEISNFYLSNFFVLLNEIELISKVFNENTLDAEIFSNEFKNFVRENKFNLTTKASFSSPGDVWAKVQFAALSRMPMKMTYLVVIYAMLFGHPVLGMDGILDLESRKLRLFRRKYA